MAVSNIEKTLSFCEELANTWDSALEVHDNDRLRTIIESAKKDKQGILGEKTLEDFALESIYPSDSDTSVSPRLIELSEKIMGLFEKTEGKLAGKKSREEERQELSLKKWGDFQEEFRKYSAEDQLIARKILYPQQVIDEELAKTKGKKERLDCSLTQNFSFLEKYKCEGFEVEMRFLEEMCKENFKSIPKELIELSNALRLNTLMMLICDKFIADTKECGPEKIIYSLAWINNFSRISSSIWDGNVERYREMGEKRNLFISSISSFVGKRFHPLHTLGDGHCVARSTALGLFQFDRSKENRLHYLIYDLAVKFLDSCYEKDDGFSSYLIDTLQKHSNLPWTVGFIFSNFFKRTFVVFDYDVHKKIEEIGVFGAEYFSDSKELPVFLHASDIHCSALEYLEEGQEPLPDYQEIDLHDEGQELREGDVDKKIKL